MIKHFYRKSLGSNQEAIGNDRGKGRNQKTGRTAVGFTAHNMDVRQGNSDKNLEGI